MSSRFDEETARLAPALPPGWRLVMVGSTSFWGEDSPDLCRQIAVRLAGIGELIAITGGMTGVGETFALSFAGERRRLGLPEHLYHLLPRGFGACESGLTLCAGIDYEERREVLGRLGQVYVVVEGGPGTEHELSVARRRGAAVIPVARAPAGMPGRCIPVWSRHRVPARLIGNSCMILRSPRMRWHPPCGGWWWLPFGACPDPALHRTRPAARTSGIIGCASAGR